MRCYFCKAKIVHATRTLVSARNAREKSNFRDLCDICYERHMLAQGCRRGTEKEKIGGKREKTNMLREADGTKWGQDAMYVIGPKNWTTC